MTGVRVTRLPMVARLVSRMMHSRKNRAILLVVQVTISEIMVVSDNGRYPQWIELRNSSDTRGVNLNAWRLKIENEGTDVDSRQNVTVPLPDGYIIGPNQTLLIATRRGSAPEPLNSQRVMLLWADSKDGGARKALEVDNSRFSMLSMKGFTLTLFGKDQTGNTHADKVDDWCGAVDSGQDWYSGGTYLAHPLL